MSATDELKPCPFCGGEAEIVGDYYMEWIAECVECCASSMTYATEAEAVEAWNTRAATTIGKVQVEIEPVLQGTLTAEQVRKCVRIGACDHGLWDALDEDTDWQAISDELNAELGSGTCKLEPLSALDVTLNMLGQTEWGACSECGCAVPMDAMFCNECGKAVKR